MSTITGVPSYAEARPAFYEYLKSVVPAKALEVFYADADQLALDHPSTLPLQLGDVAPSFQLMNATGQPVSLLKLLKKGPVVLTFYRGTWCPFCNLQLKIYQQALPQIQALGATLVAISGQKPDDSLDMAQKNQLEFEVLSDPSFAVSAHYTKIHLMPEGSTEEMKQFGRTYDSFYSDESHRLLVPAVYVIGQDGRIVFARSEGGDYRDRVEPADIVAALETLK
jgi:peroxiredoxin